MVCCIDDQTFQGEGKSKKEAKLACSQQAIEAIVGIKISENRTMPEKSNPRANCDLDDWMELEGKNPVSILNELYPGIQYRKKNFLSKHLKVARAKKGHSNSSTPKGQIPIKNLLFFQSSSRHLARPTLRNLSFEPR